MNCIRAYRVYYRAFIGAAVNALIVGWAAHSPAIETTSHVPRLEELLAYIERNSQQLGWVEATYEWKDDLTVERFGDPPQKLSLPGGSGVMVHFPATPLRRESVAIDGDRYVHQSRGGSGDQQTTWYFDGITWLSYDAGQSVATRRTRGQARPFLPWDFRDPLGYRTSKTLAELLATASPTALRENGSGDVECVLVDPTYSSELFIVFGNSVSYLPVRAEVRLKGGEINHRIQVEYLRVVDRNAWIPKEITIEFPEVEARVAASLRELPVVKKSVGRLLDVVPIQTAGRLEFELPDGVRIRDLVVE